MYASISDDTAMHQEIAADAHKAFPPEISDTELEKARNEVTIFQGKIEEVVLSGGETIQIPSIAAIESLRQSYAVVRQEEVRQKAEID